MGRARHEVSIGRRWADGGKEDEAGRGGRRHWSSCRGGGGGVVLLFPAATLICAVPMYFSLGSSFLKITNSVRSARSPAGQRDLHASWWVGRVAMWYGVGLGRGEDRQRYGMWSGYGESEIRKGGQ